MRSRSVLLLTSVLAALAVAGAARAADPIGGAWLGAGGQFREHLHTIAAGAVDVRAAEPYALPEYPACTVASGQVLGSLHFVGTTSQGYRRYEGQWLGWETSGATCKFTGLGGQWTAELRPGSDPFQRPPLPEGPDNVLALYAGSWGTGSLPASSNFGFNRKSSPSQGAGAGKADTAAPAVKALASSGRRGTTIQLRYTVTDDSRESSEKVTLRAGKTLTSSGWTKLGPARGKIYFLNFRPQQSLTGTFRFCVRSRDRALNTSAPSCATLTIL